MIGTLSTVILDCPDPLALARFYSELPACPSPAPTTTGSTSATGPRLAFQLAPDHQPPQWPDPGRPQQFHLDVRVADVEVAERRCWRWAPPGCRRGDRVYADPAGHPFCLIW